MKTLVTRLGEALKNSDRLNLFGIGMVDEELLRIMSRFDWDGNFISQPKKPACLGCNGRGGWYSPDNGQWVSCNCK